MRVSPQNNKISTIQSATPLSSTGVPIPNEFNRASLVYNFVIPAGKTLPCNATGNEFYVVASSAPVFIRPHGGTFIQYAQGTGEHFSLSSTFPSLEIRNDNTFSVVVQLFVGFDTFIDNRLILAIQQYPTIVYPTYSQPVSAPASVIDVIDLSGSQFRDINGILQLALYRIEIQMSNLDAGVVYTLQKAGATTANDPAVCAIQPQDTIVRPISGNYRIRSGAAINMIVCELYATIPQS